MRGLQLSETLHANKLAVCLGDGSRYDTHYDNMGGDDLPLTLTPTLSLTRYDTHYDNMGGDDLRKLTALLYLQREWTVEHGGCFRMFTRQEGSA